MPSTTRKTILLSMLLILALVACRPAEVDPPLPAATPGPERRTSIEVVDAVIDAVLAGDQEVLGSMVRLTTAGCTTASGLGGPPKCRPDQADGTEVSFFPILGPGEGSPVPPEQVESLLDFQVQELYAVYELDQEIRAAADWPEGKYGLIFIPQAEGAQITLIVSDAGIVGMDSSSQAPDQLLEQRAERIILAPLAP
jgi:hypothetical protein